MKGEYICVVFKMYSSCSMAVKNKKVLDIYIDESGDYGFKETCSELYLVSFVFHIRNMSIKKQEKYLNNKLEKLGFSGMIHSRPLVNNKGEYSEYSIELKREIFWSLLNFLRLSNINVKTIIVDKKYINNSEQLEMKLYKETLNFFNDNREFFNFFDEINVYYDNGQEPLTKMFDDIFIDFVHINRIINFDKVNNRLFQVVDLVTFIDKINYKINNKKKLTKTEKYFFTNEDLRELQKISDKKNL